ncbi:MAG: histidine phosphatase family protein [Rickettsiales bacterium]
MKYISILRHGKSPQNPLDDRSRILSEEGRLDIENLANKLKSHNIIFDFIISSPIKRAKQTFEIIKSNQKASFEVEWSESLYSYEDKNLNKIITDINDKYSNVLIVGHNPIISEIGCNLCKDESHISCLPGSFKQFEIDIELWKNFIPNSGKLIQNIQP